MEGFLEEEGLELGLKGQGDLERWRESTKGDDRILGRQVKQVLIMEVWPKALNTTSDRWF